MMQFGSLARAAALVGLLFSAGSVVTPAFAAKAEVELLKSYLGNWKGRGTLSGANTETVVCKLAITPGNADKINYSGRCTLAGSNLAINGTLAYIDEKGRYEAAMTSNATFSGIAVGRKQGGGVVFNLKERDTTEGQDMTITADIVLNNGAINVAFNVVDNASGETIRAKVPFSK
jgi:hypothetical protein